MLDPAKYTESLIAECRAAFKERLLYVGLQGSYMRGEATERSDIDIMIILDHLSVSDMDQYRCILKRVGSFELSCGFICGRAELECWNPLEICQLKHSTMDLFGSLPPFLPKYSRADELNYAKLSLGNLYHELCHRYIHSEIDENTSRFRNTCKGLFFLIQNLHYLESNIFIVSKSELKRAVSNFDRAMLAMADLPDGFDFKAAFNAVFEWCKSAFIRMDGISPD